MIPRHLDFRHLKRIVSIEKVLASKGLLDRLERRGDRWVGSCPIHCGDNPHAFTIHRQLNIWRCFTRCDAGGDVVELTRRLEGGSYMAAATCLAGLAQATTAHQHARCADVRETLSSRPSPFRPFTRQLPLDPADRFLAHKGIQPPIARRYQVGAFHGRGMLARCIAVRLFDLEGAPIAYAGRHLDPQTARTRGKWKLPSGLPKSSLLYGYHHTVHRLSRGVVLVEGPWGVLRLAQLGIPAVALLGAHLSPKQQNLLHDLPRVVLLMDGDETGRSAAKKIRQRLPNSRVVDLPEGQDPDDLTNQELVEVGRHLFLF